jgi:hypothetical protein
MDRNTQFLVFGDDAIFQNKFMDAHNKALAANLAGWFNSTRERSDFMPAGKPGGI